MATSTSTSSAPILGHKGLPLPVWKPEYEQAARRAAIEKARVLAEVPLGEDEIPLKWDDTAEYGDPEYWKRRYLAGVVEEWYCPPKVLAQLLPKAQGQSAADRMMAELSGLRPTPCSAKALVLGNCRVELAEILVQMGYVHVVSTDIVSEAMVELAAKHAADKSLSFLAMDVCNLSPLQDGEFDLVVDKGVLDAIMCGDDSFSKVSQAAKEIHRVTKLGGTFVSVSHSNDRWSGGLLSPKGVSWDMTSTRCVYDVEKSGDPETDGIVFYKYMCTKKAADS
mmetsp:Transcript_3463/g.6824  ORF Transcript_3463/g.6824 Transcript_3463/m.6824 type:complete len:280 (-) Transcript_3463:110-949(-)